EPYHTGLLELDRVFHLATRRTRLRGQPARFDLIRPLARSLLVDSEESSVPVGKARRDEMIGLLVCASAADADLVELRFGGTTRMLCVAAGVPSATQSRSTGLGLLRQRAMEIARVVRIAATRVPRDLRMRTKKPRHRHFVVLDFARDDLFRRLALFHPRDQRLHEVGTVGSWASAAMAHAGHHV